MVVTEYELGNVEIRVYRPQLSDDERELRKKQIEAALQIIGRSVAEKRRDTNDNSNQTRNIAE